MRVKILGKYWNFTRVTNLGLDPEGNEYVGHCDHPDTPHKTFKVKMGQPLEEELDTIIHEYLHVIFPQADEDFVHTSATDLKNILCKVYDFKRKE